jgi:uncharacterized repeat protein (TIGR03803 family)
MTILQTLCFRGATSARRFGALVIFWAALSMASSAQTFSNLFTFDQGDGANPDGRLVQGNDGDFYGVTNLGGAYGQGEVYKVTTEGAITVLHSFCNPSDCTDGSQPAAGLILGKDGNFYGTTPTNVFEITPSGSLTVLSTSVGSYSPLVQGNDGNFYGTVQVDGNSTRKCGGPCGTIFRITSAGVVTTLHYFKGIDGWSPEGGLAQGTDGDFYGTTAEGGAYYSGVVFKVSSSGTYTLLHSFTGQMEGCQPVGELIQGTDGNFYGTTLDCGTKVGDGDGIAYKITPSGRLTILHSFNATGEWPRTGLVQASDGNFYGTTPYGGNSNSSICHPTCGSAYRLTPSGKFSTLYEFCSQSGCSDGAGPSGSLVQGADGKLYGATYYGGSTICPPPSSCGTLFTISPKLPADPALQR